MDSLKEIIELLKRTGDKFILLNKGKPIGVIMTFEDYNDLIFTKSGVSDLTEEELLNKINREIAIWKASQDKEKIEKFDLYSGFKKINN